MELLKQIPAAGIHLLRHCGDVLEFRLESSTPIQGRAFLRTNLGNASLNRREIIDHVEQEITPGFQAWRNLPMVCVNEFTFSLKLMLTEEGHFEGKCFIADIDNFKDPVWVNGENVCINVEPAAYCCSNGVYCAFVRQFGSNQHKSNSTLPDSITQKTLDTLDKNDYSVIPPSGTFRSLIRELDHIFDTLHCRILHLLPIHPTPTVYGRMGRFGSPYAALDFTGINPELAEFDRSATPLEQFQELADAVHRKDGKLFIDIAINHTGWAAKLHETHPEWLVRNPDGSIHSPGAWGVTWGDLTELDHSKLELWKYLASVFTLWCTRGVDGFRCDAGYMIPQSAWEYIIATVREQFPDTVFLLEGLGGDPAVTSALLNQANMNWAYSELFQNYNRTQIEGYLNYAWHQSSGDGLMIHYAETHDNSRLAAVSPEYAKMRTALSALTSVNGAFGFTNGVEWFAREKIDVHEASALNWGAAENQVEFIARLNVILASLSCFHNGAVTSFIDCHAENCLLISRTNSEGKEPLLIAINLDTTRSTSIHWNVYSAPFNEAKVYDLLSGRPVDLMRQPGGTAALYLQGAGVLCLTPDKNLLEHINKQCTHRNELSECLRMQKAKALAASILEVRENSIISVVDDLTEAAEKLLHSPEEFLEHLYGKGHVIPYVTWQVPEDIHRMVMIPPGHFLLIKAPHRIQVAIEYEGKLRSFKNCLQDAAGNYFLLIPPQQVPAVPKEALIWAGMLSPEKIYRTEAHLVYLPKDVDHLQIGLERKEFHRAQFNFMQGNGKGALLWHTVEPGELRSRYNAVLLANLNPDFPENRHIMLRRFRIWSFYHEKMQAFCRDCMKSFHVDHSGAGIWHFVLPVGNGLFIELSQKMELLHGKNAVRLTLQRHTCDGQLYRLQDKSLVHFLIRPDIEDRSFHNTTKASAGPQQNWPNKIKCGTRNFFFTPAPDRILSVTAAKGRFVRNDEWKYMIWQQKEAERGLDPNSDLYSPGYFEISLAGGDSVTLIGQVMRSESEERLIPETSLSVERGQRQYIPIETAIHRSMDQFIVARDGFKTVIAGYPWFLDWGRDTLIAARGLISDPEFREDARKILLRFALFAENGTIPNMISGSNAENRDTSDAPLWLFTACRDLCKTEGNHDFLKTGLNDGRTLLQVLIELAEGIIKGTPNGIKADPESMLIFSPSHFTWMDTNYPAGTPREGYPVEIQALWYAALNFLSEVLPESEAEQWHSYAERVKHSIHQYFVVPGMDYLSDCLHCSPGIGAAKAVADDHLRPNQLLALTLGAVDDPELSRKILAASAKLLVPGGIRSLSDSPVRYALPVYGKGRLLNDPKAPYWGHYEGDEDTRRKPAYHNGTAWTWLFPSYCEAFFKVYGEEGKAVAKSLLSSMSLPVNAGCICQITEIMDGDYPHTQRGCGAQAWGMSEFLRVWRILHNVNC